MTSSQGNDILKFPILNIQEDMDYPVPFQDPYQLALFLQNKQLLIAKRKLVVIKGSIIMKVLTYEEDIVTATYTHFSNSQELEEVLVVSLKKHIHVYYPDGKSYVCSLPFALKNALPFESGLVLQRDQNESLIPHNGALYSNTSHLNSAAILTLVDPMGDFRIVATASTSVISSKKK